MTARVLKLPVARRPNPQERGQRMARIVAACISALAAAVAGGWFR